MNEHPLIPIPTETSVRLLEPAANFALSLVASGQGAVFRAQATGVDGTVYDVVLTVTPRTPIVVGGRRP